MKTTLTLALAALALSVPALAAPPKAAVTPQQAKTAAVAKVPGTAKSAKYEFEDGRWQYAVLVAAKSGGMYEVEVSSTTGKVTDMEKTSRAEEAKEAAADRAMAKKAAMHGK